MKVHLTDSQLLEVYPPGCEHTSYKIKITDDGGISLVVPVWHSAIIPVTFICFLNCN